MKGIGGIGHVAIKVSDVGRTLDFYVGRLGFEEMLRLTRDDGRLWLIYLRITDTQYLEIFPDAETDRAPGRNANGLNHVCLEVDDIEAVAKALEAKGVALTAAVKTGADGNRQAWMEDPDGNRIELMQMAPDGIQAKAIARLRALA